ncbi:16S rRNA processing protein RimM [Alphaproteobacteria bacterium KMM 3653]|uniref:Ribosome maturation factor RimM n=1 Tax=Harenicola maris TaxID=2841044 RepID=A0AAP2CT81_9RHOB|nr:ribosome maturation factor RimM [Harenicola maris]MBT0959285.1 16S rRNA processing protein RimM [Harenicola maris]
MNSATDRVCVGAIAGSFGVKGEVRVKSFCAMPEDIAAYGPLWTEDGARSFDIRLTRAVKGAFAARLSGVGTKEAADALRGTPLYLDRALLPDLDEDEYYHADLIGLSVYDTGGGLLGTVKAMHDHGAGDLMEVQLDGGAETVLIPFTLKAVPTVDIAKGRIVTDPPEGTFGSKGEKPE